VNPLFIISLPRSGSTLLQAILAKNKEVITFSEPWLFLTFSSILINGSNHAVYDSNFLYEATQHFFKNFNNQVLSQSVNSFFNAVFQQTNGKYKYFLDKTPRYYLIFNHLIDLFPQARFIILKRNLLDVIKSVSKSWHKNNLKFRMNRIDVFEGPKYIYEGTKLLDKRALVLEYENLVSDPVSSLKLLSNYLDLEFNKEILENLDFGRYSYPYGDKVEIQQKSTIRKKSEDWKSFVLTSYRKYFIKNFVAQFSKQEQEFWGIEQEDIFNTLKTIRMKPFRLGVNDYCTNQYDILWNKLDLGYNYKKITNKNVFSKYGTK